MATRIWKGKGGEPSNWSKIKTKKAKVKHGKDIVIIYKPPKPS